MFEREPPKPTVLQISSTKSDEMQKKRILIKKKNQRGKPHQIDKFDQLPTMIHEGGSGLKRNGGELPTTKRITSTIVVNSPGDRSDRRQPHRRVISTSREVTGIRTPHHPGSVRSSQYARVRYNGNAFGGFNMTDSDFPRKSNLSDRKQ